jgi:tetratricopeptide (TPR) repeat protein
MPVRRNITVLFALAALLLAGCSDSLPTAIETDDPAYRQGKQLQRLGRNPEALVAFLKVIEKRGEQFSPESHLEAGLIYLRHMKDPEEAIHHFRKYLELQRKSKEAPLVRGKLEDARRELLKSFRGRPLEDQSQWLNLRDQVDALQRENDRLKAELASLNGGAAPAPLLRVTHASIDSGVARPAVPPPAVDDSPIALAPVPSSPLAGSLLPGKPAAAKAAGRKHVVTIGDTLYSISKKYNVKLEELQAANREIVPGVTAKLPLGAELKVP